MGILKADTGIRVQSEVPVPVFRMPNSGQKSLLDCCGVHPDRSRTNGASGDLYDEAKAEAEEYRITNPGKELCTPQLHFGLIIKII